MINPAEFRSLIIRPALKAAGMWSEAAENLLLGTAVHESVLVWLTERNNKPGRATGFYQMEPATADDICHRYLATRSDLSLMLAKATWPHVSAPPLYSHLNGQEIARLMVEDLRFSTLMCRVRYWMVPQALPDANDIDGLARYWKKWYNTELGAGEVSVWAKEYRQHCLPES